MRTRSVKDYFNKYAIYSKKSVFRIAYLEILFSFRLFQNRKWYKTYSFGLQKIFYTFISMEHIFLLLRLLYIFNVT